MGLFAVTLSTVLLHSSPKFVFFFFFFFCYLVTLHATRGELLLVASGAVNFLFPGNKAFGANGRLTHYAAETLLVPLSGLVFHLFRSYNDAKQTERINKKKIKIKKSPFTLQSTVS